MKTTNKKTDNKKTKDLLTAQNRDATLRNKEKAEETHAVRTVRMQRAQIRFKRIDRFIF